jgi:hypothetical protein
MPTRDFGAFRAAELGQLQQVRSLQLQRSSKDPPFGCQLPRRAIKLASLNVGFMGLEKVVKSFFRSAKSVSNLCETVLNRLRAYTGRL